MFTNSQTEEDIKNGLTPQAAKIDDQITPGTKAANAPGYDERFQTKFAAGVDAKALQKELEKAVSGEVRFDDGSRALYSTDASNYRQIPIGVVLPKCEEDIINTIAVCRKHGAPLLSRGGGTSLAGQCCNVAVVMDMSKYYNQVLHIDNEKKQVRVQPGIVLDTMRHATEKEAGLTFGPDPATHNHCTIGGMLGNNSCGVHSVMASFEGNGARTSDNTESLTIVTYDGVKMKVGPTSDEEYERIQQEGGRKAEIYKKLRDLRDKYADLIRKRYPDIPRRVSGYNLDDLLPEKGFNVARALVGSESTLVTIVEATMKLLDAPKKKALVVMGFSDVYQAGYSVMEVLKFKPIACEGIDDNLISYMKRKNLNIKDLPLLPKGNGWLLVEFGGNTQEEADNRAKELMNHFKQKDNAPDMNLIDDPAQEEKIWEIRESGLGATAWVPGEPMTVPGWEDSAVAPENVGDYLKDLRKLFTKYDYDPALYGHFGQGCIHCRVSFDLLREDGIEKYKRFTVEAAHLVVKYGGSISGEHGDGQARGDLLEIMFGKELIQAFREFKEIWDPEWKMNPGKIVDTYGQADDLRLGVDYNPPALKTHFQFPDDAFSWERVTLKCVGVGKCRRHEGGVMCPSYMVTREEEHSTRGRSRMLYEMLQGNVLKGGWKDDHVKDSLDLCLACKGCKNDCPVNVDMATYKAEFLSHYYAGRLRPRTAYVFGWIYWWSRLSSLMPGVVNFFMHAPVVSTVVKAIAGVEQRRKMPRYAERTFKSWFREREKKRHRTNGTQPSALREERQDERWQQRVGQGMMEDGDSARAQHRQQESTDAHQHYNQQKEQGQPTNQLASEHGTSDVGGRSAGQEQGATSAGTENDKRVILWADTFNNYFLPQTLVAAVDVLEAAGFEVMVPKRSLCCGRPLYDFGMLKTAKRMLLEIMDTLAEEIRDGVPIVGLEPSCVAVFRDELHNLFPHNEQASRLSKQVFTLGELLAKKAPDFKVPQMQRKAVVHGHCHHRSIMGIENEKKILDKTKLDYEVLPTTCCGMAGYFGYEKGRHYEVSIKAGETLLLPKVREADEETLIITDGFSCREQIEQETTRKGLHLAQVLKMGMDEQRGEKAGALPERKYVDGMALINPHKMRNTVVLLGAIGVGLALLSVLKRK